MKKIIIISILFVTSSLTFTENAAAVEIRRWEDAISVESFDDDTVFQITTSPLNPAIFATVSDDGEIALWDLTTQSMQWRFHIKTSKSPVFFTNSGQHLATVRDCFLTILNVSDGAPIRAIDLRIFPRTNESPAPTCDFFGYIPKIIFTANDAVAYVVQHDHVIEVDLVAGRVTREIGRYLENTPDECWTINDIILSDDEQFLYSACHFGLRTFHLPTGNIANRRDNSEVNGLPIQEIQGGILSRDGLYRIFSTDIYVFVVDNIRNQIVRRQMVASDTITALEISHDLANFIISSTDGTSRVFDIATGTEEVRLDDSRGTGERTSFSALAAPTGLGVVLSGDYSGRITIWQR